MPSYLTIFFILTALSLFQFVLSYGLSYQRARKLAKSLPLKYASSPIHVSSVLYYLISPFLASIIDNLPFGLGFWNYYTKRGYFWMDGIEEKGLTCRQHYGNVFVIAHPGGIKIHVLDAETAYQLAHRPKDFPKNIAGYSMLNIFGENVLTTEGAKWMRYRKVTAPPFSERNNALVWAESIKQSKDMLYSFTHDMAGKESALVVEKLSNWTMTMALHVIAGGGFNLHMVWPTKSVQANKSNSHPAELKRTLQTGGHQMTFQHAVELTVNNLELLVGLPGFILRYSPFKPFRELYAAQLEFFQYLKEMIASEKANMNEANQGDQQGLLQAMVLNSTAGNQLKEEEILANLFIVSLAGHETTARILHHCFILMALDQNYQNKIHKEIDSITDSRDERDLDYVEDYPKMRYIMAMILEGLRLFPPVGEFLKTTLETRQELNCDGTTVTVPPKTPIIINVVAIQRDTKIWGKDAQVWNPHRWLKETGYVPPKNSVNQSKDHADLLCPPRGSMMVFSDGARNCLGRKFALVEICAVIGTVLRNHRIELVVEDGSDLKTAEAEAWRRLYDQEVVLAMRMKKDVKVRFVKR